VAAATHSATPPASRPSIEQLREQLGIARESMARLLETHMRENEEREDWAKEMRKSGVSLGHQAFDLTVKAVLRCQTGIRLGFSLLQQGDIRESKGCRRTLQVCRRSRGQDRYPTRHRPSLPRL
jgi:hypothetical protein